MTHIDVIGAGISDLTMTAEAKTALAEAEVIFASSRLLERLSEDIRAEKTLKEGYLPRHILPEISMLSINGKKRFAVLVSGDVGFYSAAKKICDTFEEGFENTSIRLVPGISSVNAFCARLRIPWGDAYLFSAHGKNTEKNDIVGAVRRNKKVFCLAGENAQELGKALCGAGFENVTAYIGENLGEDCERIYETTAKDIAENDFPPLTVMLFKNDDFDSRIVNGLPDARFTRIKGIPMTKSEIRAIALSKLAIHPNDICYDIGAGTGSVTVEMALAAYSGHVYAFEINDEACDLIRANCTKFHIGNVTIINGNAIDNLCRITKPNVVFLGGSGGENNLKKIISIILDKNPDVKLVISTVTLEAFCAAVSELKSGNIPYEIFRISIDITEKAGKYHMFRTLRPISLILTGGEKNA